MREPPGKINNSVNYRPNPHINREPIRGIEYCNDDYVLPDFPPAPEPNGDPDTDRAVLVHLYNSTNGPN